MSKFVFDFGLFWAAFWSLWGRLLGAKLAPKSDKKSTKNRPGAKNVARFVLGAVLEASWRSLSSQHSSKLASHMKIDKKSMQKSIKKSMPSKFQFWFNLDLFSEGKRRHVGTNIESKIDVNIERPILQKSLKNKWKINEANDAFVHSVARFFERGDPHETLYFTIWKLLLHFLCSCVLFLKSTKKMAPKFKPQFYSPKAPKSGPGDPYWVPKWSWINVRESKNP